MKNILFIIATITLIAACTDNSDNNALETKRTELDSLQGEMATLKTAIAEVQADIAKLDTNARANAIAVMVTEIAEGVFKNPFEVQALVESNQNVMVSPEVPGKITKIYVREGQRVSRGQVIASLDGSLANSQIAELEGALTLAKINYEKQERLWNQKIGSEMQYLQAKNQYENLQNSIATARTQLGKYSLRAPISGTIDEIMANAGEMVGGITSGPVMRIVNLKDIKIKAEVSEKYVGQMKVGQTVLVKFASIGLETQEKVSAIGNVINPNSRTFSVYIKPSKNLSKLKPNMLAIVTAYDYEDTDAISIPTKLVRTDGQQHFVYVVKTNGEKRAVEKRTIEIEQQFPSQTIIKSGLAIGDLLITEGANSVIVGDEVKLVE